MNITKELTDELNGTLTVELKKEDYQGKVDEVLADYRRKASIKGFRPGKAPMGMIRKMYGTAVLVEEINKLVSEKLSGYLLEEKLNILGDPLPSEREDNMQDFEKQDDFTFYFDIGLAPEPELKLSKKNKVPFYEIEIEEKMRNDYQENYRRRYGSFQPADAVEEKDMLKGSVEQLDEQGAAMEGGLANPEATLSVEMIKDEDIKKQFVGAKAGDIIDFDLKKAYPNDAEVSSMLGVAKEQVAELSGNFRFTLASISRFAPAELNQEFYDKAFGEGNVNSEEEFSLRIDDEIRSNLNRDSEYKFKIDLKDLAVEKTSFDLPEAFLKRWLLKINEDKEDITAEDIENEFDHFLKDLRWQLIRGQVSREQEFKVSEEELLAEAKENTRAQFAQYGMYYAEDEQIEGFAKELLKREEDRRQMHDRILDEKVLAHLRDLVKTDEKKTSMDKFRKMFEEMQQKS